MKAIPVDVYDKDGNMLKIEFNDGTGEHIIDAIWDETDPQTAKNREAFRRWAYKMLENKGYEILK